MTSGTFFSLTRDEAKGLFAASKNGELARFIAELRESVEVRTSDRSCEIGSHWITFQKCSSASSGILNPCFDGGRELYRTENQVASLVRPDLVPHVAKAMAEFSDDDLREALARLEPASAVAIEPVLDLLGATREFYRRAAEQGNSVLFVAGM